MQNSENSIFFKLTN